MLIDENLILKIIRTKQLEHGISKQIWILAVVELPLQFVQVGVQMHQVYNRQMNIAGRDDSTL